MSETTRIPVGEVVFREDVYPRVKRDPALVKKYASDLSVLPAIEVNQHRELIDGWHRWTAHKDQKAETIAAFVTPTTSDLHLLALASRRNSTFGWQMDIASKKHTAIKLYNGGAGWLPEHAPTVDDDGKRESETDRLARVKADIATEVGVSDRMARSYVQDVDKDLREAREARVFWLWLRCWTQEEIAEDVGMSDAAVRAELGDTADLEALPNLRKLAALYQDSDWAPPLYDVWTQPKNNNEVEHFGNTPVEFVDRLLYLYTDPFDIVIDPFAGGGQPSTHARSGCAGVGSATACRSRPARTKSASTTL